MSVLTDLFSPFFPSPISYRPSSANGSPVETHETGTVVATVTKKRRGNGDAGANIEISIGEGRFISLSNPAGLTELDSSMKRSATSQLQVLQDQMQSLMAQLQS